MEACTLINIFRLILMIFSYSHLFHDNLLFPSLVIASSAILEPSSPYYIHPNENPFLVLISFILDGSNYYNWAQAMSMSLKMKNKYAFIKKPGAIESPLSWKRCNSLVLSWLYHLVSTEISTIIIWMTEAYTMYDKIWKIVFLRAIMLVFLISAMRYALSNKLMCLWPILPRWKYFWGNVHPIPAPAVPSQCCCNALKPSSMIVSYPFSMASMKITYMLSI